MVWRGVGGGGTASIKVMDLGGKGGTIAAIKIKYVKFSKHMKGIAVKAAGEEHTMLWMCGVCQFRL